MSNPATDINLRQLIDQALMQISGGLCYRTAEAKHAQLKDAQTTLKKAQAILSTTISGANDNAR